ncbi:MAG: Gfo/Idh/MocA family oxidoreductase [Myxococcota bacterium]
MSHPPSSRPPKVDIPSASRPSEAEVPLRVPPKADIALVGVGRWGTQLARNTEALGRLALIVDTDPQALAAAHKRWPHIPTASSLDACLAQERIRAVLLATPTPLHYPMARAVLEAGRHVLVEKPMTLTRDHAQTLVQLADDHARVLGVGHQLEHHPTFVQLAALVRHGDLGHLHHIAADRTTLGRPQEAHSALWDLAAHDVGMAITLMGELPHQVSATHGTWPNSDRTVEATLALTFSAHRRAVLRVSWLHPIKTQRLIAVGTQATAVFDDVAPSSHKLLLHRHTPGQDPPAPPQPLTHTWHEPLRAACQAFIEAIDASPVASLTTDASYGLAVVTILDAAERSAAMGGTAIAVG